MRKQPKEALTYVTPKGQPLSWWRRRVMNVTNQKKEPRGWVDMVALLYTGASAVACFAVPLIVGVVSNSFLLSFTTLVWMSAALFGVPLLAREIWDKRVRPSLKRQRVRLVKMGAAADIPRWHIRVNDAVKALDKAEMAAKNMQSGMRGETLQRIAATRWDLVCLTNNMQDMRTVVETAPDRLTHDQCMEAVDTLRRSGEAVETLLVTSATLCDTVQKTVEMEKMSSVETILVANKAVDSDLALMNETKIRLQLLSSEDTAQTQMLLDTYTKTLATAGQ